jgi:protein-S-isoprenylcysteine O-methyltransferase Ste14
MNVAFVHFIALAALIYYPSIPLIVSFVHATIVFWKNLGKKSYPILILLFLFIDILILWLVISYREAIITARLYDSPWALLGFIPFIAGITIGVMSIRTLSFRVLIGMPEIMPSQEKTQLVVHGMYRYVRHPRYLEFLLEFLGITIISGLKLLFYYFPIFFLSILLLTYLEERELVTRFGTAYEEYRKTTPRIIPSIFP